MTYTENGITFSNVTRPNLNLEASPIGADAYPTSGTVVTFTGNAAENHLMVNAIDVDWNGAVVDENTTINSTADLLNWIKSAASNNQSEPGQSSSTNNGVYYYTSGGELISDLEDSVYPVVGIAVIKDDVKFVLDIHDYSNDVTKLITTKTGKDIANISAYSLTDGFANTAALVLAEGFPESNNIEDWRTTSAMDCQTRTLEMTSSVPAFAHGYLGSIKEMIAVAENITTINRMITAAEGDVLDSRYYQTSTIMPNITGYVGTTPYATYSINMQSGAITLSTGAGLYRTLYPLFINN